MRTDYLKLFFLLNKRLYRKTGFIVILCMIPVIVFGMKLVSQRESGIVRIAVVDEGSPDGGRVADMLLKEKSVFLYSPYTDESKAIDDLNGGRVDAVWVFPKDYDERISAYTKGLMGAGDTEEVPAVLITEREDTILLQLARLELFGSMYSGLSFSLYNNFISLNITDPDTEEAASYYHNNKNTGNLFRYRDYSGRSSEEADGYEDGYLMAPVKGLLLLLVLLCGLAAAMYYRDDTDKEIFTWMPVGNKWIFEHLYLLTALITGGLAVLLTFYATGLAAGTDEVLRMFIFVISCSCFCSIIRKLTPGLKSLATAIPVLMLVMLAVCPVFVYLRQLKAVQLIMPPFYYLMADNNPRYLMYFTVYTAVTIAVDVLLGRGSRCSG
ncbi:MAG: ABC transporter permease [Lachnospiraceae bacterium]|nr:ABC transporter permease [Lachnospiraceae bacterium]